MKKLYTLLMITIFLASCSKTDSSEVSVTPDNKPEKQNVGPFKIEFLGDSKLYDHSVDIAINQTEGFLEYQILSDVKNNLLIKESTVTFTGCTNPNPSYEIYWLPDLSDKSVFTKINLNTSFSNIPKTQGQLLFNFKNLDGCQKLKLKITLEKKPLNPKLGQACEGGLSNCQVITACTETGLTSYFYEVEVWNQSGSLYLNKYLNRGDGTRSLQSSNSANISANTKNVFYYSKTSVDTALTIDRISSLSTYKEKVNGQNITHSVFCDYL